MANNCGGCQLFNGPTQKCGAGRNVTATTPGGSGCFKGPASLFKGKACGGCRLFQGPYQKCGAGRNVSSTTPGGSGCYSPIPG